ncbi:AraC family transcriptional regulator [Streptomyces sp. NBC_00576]|uniref:AraC family transcriptional regulator n=1 Tax=Streptomyces sp. NBC_00576 TaxID=2903665 RepID=UPI002E8236BE|nr:AraC family transcriptional regulator [Streptomyces sp. NBC_00576]WUB74885.1 AraC family transcriptional regulator [Streptomyces sp. NBC_00576]
MDLLSQVTAAMRSGRPRWVRIEARGAWGQRFQSVPGAAFHLVLQGSAVLMPNADDKIPLGAGCIALLPGGVEHGVADGPDVPAAERSAGTRQEFSAEPRTLVLGESADAGQTASTVVLSGMFPFDRSLCHPLLNDLPEAIYLPARLQQEPSLRAVLDSLCHELEHPDMGSDLAIGTLLDTLLVYVLRWWYREHGAGTGWGPALNDRAISRVLCSMHNYPGEPWTVERLGAVADLSRSAFARRFTDLVGRPPLGHLTWVRMNTAAERLRKTEEPLSSVAQQVGYTSEFAFSSAFRREFGIAPSAYRRQEATAGPRRSRARPGTSPRPGG